MQKDVIYRQAAIDAMKDMYRAAEKWLRDATDDVTKARAESCMASLVEIKLRIEKIPVVQPDHVADVSKKVDVDDCISRREVKEKLKQNLTYMRAFGVDRCINLIDEIPAVEPESKWISCEEKMPEEDLWTGASQQYSYGVLMYVLDDDGEEMIDFGHTIDGKWYSDTADAYVENSSNWKVIAWMLPPSYKENE